MSVLNCGGVWSLSFGSVSLSRRRCFWFLIGRGLPASAKLCDVFQVEGGAAQASRPLRLHSGRRSGCFHPGHCQVSPHAPTSLCRNNRWGCLWQVIRHSEAKLSETVVVYSAETWSEAARWRFYEIDSIIFFSHPRRGSMDWREIHGFWFYWSNWVDWTKRNECFQRETSQRYCP